MTFEALNPTIFSRRLAENRFPLGKVATLTAVIAGLDPAIHLFEMEIF
jgi:hypothetical protein